MYVFVSVRRISPMDLLGIAARLLDLAVDLGIYLSTRSFVRLLGIVALLTGVGIWLARGQLLAGGLLVGLGLFLLLTAQLRAWDR